MGEPRLGDEIEVWCRYCRLNLFAVVSALKDGQVAKVQCRTCRHFQDYRPPVPDEVRREKLIKKAMRIADRHTSGGVPGRTARQKAPPASEALSPEAVARAMWQEATKDAHPLKTKVYDPHRRYVLGDLIVDKAMGLGVVREVREDDDTVSVLFRDGFRRLPHGVPRDDEE